MMIRRFAAAALVAGLTITGCSSGNRKLRRPGVTPRSATTSDINPQDPATLQQGGNLRLALTEYPSNFNSLHIDGNVADAGAMLRSTMPRAFRVASDGSTTVNTDYFTNIELTSESPQVVTYTINPKAVWSDGTPDHLGGHRVADQRNQRQGQGLPHRQPQRRRPRRKGDPRRRRPPGGGHLRQAVLGVAGHVRRQHHAAAQEHDRDPEVFNKGQLERPRAVRRTVHRHVAGPHRAANHVDAQPEVVGHTAAAGQHHLPGARRRRPHPGPAEQHHRRHRGGLAPRA